jgi:hypothetical protein
MAQEVWIEIATSGGKTDNSSVWYQQLNKQEMMDEQEADGGHSLTQPSSRIQNTLSPKMG